MPEKLATTAIELASVGLLAMVKPNDGSVNWKAVGILIAILIPMMSATWMGGLFVGGLKDIPDELKAIHLKVDSLDDRLRDLEITIRENK